MASTPRAVVWLAGAAGAPPEPLRASLARRGLAAAWCTSAFAVMAEVTRGEGPASERGRGVIVILVEPSRLHDPAGLVRAVSRYAGRAACWVYEAAADGTGRAVPTLRAVTAAEALGWSVRGDAADSAAAKVNAGAMSPPISNAGGRGPAHAAPAPASASASALSVEKPGAADERRGPARGAWTPPAAGGLRLVGTERTVDAGSAGGAGGAGKAPEERGAPEAHGLGARGHSLDRRGTTSSVAPGTADAGTRVEPEPGPEVPGAGARVELTAEELAVLLGDGLERRDAASGGPEANGRVGR